MPTWSSLWKSFLTAVLNADVYLFLSTSFTILAPYTKSHSCCHSHSRSWVLHPTLSDSVRFLQKEQNYGHFYLYLIALRVSCLTLQREKTALRNWVYRLEHVASFFLMVLVLIINSEYEKNYTKTVRHNRQNPNTATQDKKFSITLKYWELLGPNHLRSPLPKHYRKVFHGEAVVTPLRGM